MPFLKTFFFALTLTFVAQSGSAQYSPEPDEPTRARAENHIAGAGSFRLNIQGYLGGAGRSTTVLSAEGRENAGMATTFGLQAQGLVPLGQYALVGPAFSLRSLRERGASDRLNVYGFDLAFGAHYAVVLSDSIAIDPYVLFTIGLSIADSDQSVLSEDTEFGVGLGIRAGATLWFDHAFGARFGVGHQSIHFWPESDADTRVRFREFAFEFGISIRFGT